MNGDPRDFNPRVLGSNPSGLTKYSLANVIGKGHREAGHAALDACTEWKSVHVDYSGRLQRAQIDNR
jgi:hypothetical protein